MQRLPDFVLSIQSMPKNLSQHQVVVPGIQVPPSPTHSSPQRPDNNSDLFVEGSSGQFPSPEPPHAAPKQKTYHPFLNGRPCNKNGHFLPMGTPPPPRPTAAPGDWKPFDNEVQFKVADFLYHQEEMSQGNINYLLKLWALSLLKHGSVAPFNTYKHIYDRIDAIEEGDAPWKCFKTSVDDSEVDDTTPNWKKQEYDIWYHNPEVVVRNMLPNPDFHKEFDAAPYVELDKYGTRQRSDFMSADFAWRQCDIIYEENQADNDGSMFVPIILGSDKTTVTVGMGDIEYHPLYLSIGNVWNPVRRAHRNAVIPIGFLAILKSDPVYRCPDGHFHRVIFGLGPFIADYPEQIMLAGVKQGCCPRCTALPTDIDGAASVQRNELTDALLEEFDSTTLWDEYGVDTEIIPFTHNDRTEE
ncbi:hypothetical protein BYT27DRAFT_7264755 [Phlegmacium glaucopus]|nr:hypothetical protein BYT27DRAFT_7264755 [Phlegmacium glaucopus]